MIIKMIIKVTFEEYYSMLNVTMSIHSGIAF